MKALIIFLLIFSFGCASKRTSTCRAYCKRMGRECAGVVSRGNGYGFKCRYTGDKRKKWRDRRTASSKEKAEERRKRREERKKKQKEE